MGEDGLIKRAEQASQAQANAEAADREAMDELVQYLEGVMAEKTTLVDMYNAAIAANCAGGDDCTDPENHLHIGDYVNYENPTSGTRTAEGTLTGAKDGVDDGYSNWATSLAAEDITQTYTLSSTKNNVKWRVLGIDEETGGIKLIADSVLEKDVETSTETGLYVYGAKSYLNAVTTTDENGVTTEGYLDKICSMYANTTKYGSGTYARSVTAEDFNALVGIDTSDTDSNNVLSYDLFTASGTGLGYGQSSTFEGYTPELWEAVQNGTMTEEQLEEKQPITVKQDAYYYAVLSEETDDSDGLIINKIANDLICCTNSPYWLASRGAVVFSSIAVFGPGAAGPGSGVGLVFSYGNDNDFFSSGGEYGGALAVRPVVCLPSSITAEELQ